MRNIRSGYRTGAVGGLSESISMTGAAGNNILTGNMSTPTGDLDIRVDASATSWLSIDNLIVKDDQSSQRNFYLAAPVGGTLQFVWWDSGGTVRVATSAAHGLTAGRWKLRVTLDVDNGSGGHTVVFYKRQLDTDSWTTITTTNAGAFTTSVKNSSIPVGIWTGRSTAGGSAAGSRGEFYSAEIRSGIAGTVVAVCYAPLLSPFTDPFGNVWTRNL
jgi:hypothetical protein